MRKIIFIFLFFCLAITTVFAQATIDIATPNSNGLSNNQVDDFDVATDGTILNNSTVGGTAQLGGTTVTANPNITAGSEASLILLQVTGSSGSDLNGTIEVFGSEAGLIIANPNGIDCDGCGFINTNRVDLVTGTANFSGDDLTGFSIDDAAIFFVRNTGFVSDAVADELNLVSRDLRIQAQAKANTTLRLLAGNDTYDYTTNIITSDDTEASAHSIQISASGYLEANYIELISTEISSSHGILNAGGDIEAGRLKLDSNGLFRNQEGGGNLGDINISGLLEVITADRFINNGNITADTLTITTDEFFNNHNGTTQLGKIFVIDTFSLSTPNASYTNTGTVTSDSLNLTIGGDFTHESTTLEDFTFNNLAITTDSFTNNTIINLAGNLTITTNNFVNTSGSISTDSFALSVTGDFDYSSNFINIATTNLDLSIGGDYTQGAGVTIDIAGDLSIQVSGEASLDDNASIQARNLFFSAYEVWNRADITITENATFDIVDYFRNGFYFEDDSRAGGDIKAVSFNATAGNDFLNRYSATIIANDFNVTVGNAFRNLEGAEITADSFNVIAGNFFENDELSTINVDNFNVTTGTYFSNNSNAEISAVSFNVTTERDFVNDNSTIDVDNFNVTVGEIFQNFDTATINAVNFNVTVGDIFQNFDTATINADNFNVTAEGDFQNNNSTIDVDNFNVTIGAQFYNIELSTINANDDFNVTADYFSFTSYSTISTDSFNVTTVNFFSIINATITADSFDVTTGTTFSIQQDSTINANDFNVTSGNIFRNIDGAIINADTVTIEVANFSNDINNTATVSSDSLNFILTDNFTHNVSTLNGFNNFSNLAITTDGNFTNNSTIDLDGNLTITANTFINTGGVVSSDTLVLSVAGDFDYKGTITANTYNLNVGGDFSYDDPASDFTWGANDSLVVSGNADITATDFTNAGTISVNAILNITATSTADNSFENTGGVAADTLTLSVAGDFDYIADYLNNGTITNNAFNLNVGGDFSNNDASSDFTWGDNDSLVVSGDVGITTNNFTNGGTISADTLAISVAGDFDYIADYLNNGTITNNAFNLNVGGNFINNDLSDDFTWGDNDSLVVSGNAGITTNNFTNGGTISADTLAISVAGDFDYSSDFLNAGTITADNLNFTLRNGVFTNDTTIDLAAGSLGITANNFLNIGASSVTANNFTLILTNNFNNGGSINVTGSGSSGSLAITAGYTAINQGSIVSASLDLTTDDFFRNLTGGNIEVDNFVITAGGKVTNTANITVSGTLNITANNDSSRDNDTTGFYVSNRGDINATTLNIAAVDNFYNRGNITATNFNITRAKSVFFLNREIDSFYAAGSTYDGGNISLAGDSSFIAAGGVIENYGNIDLGSNNLDITADIYTNQAGSNVTATTLTLDVSSFVQHGTINATVEFK